MDRAVILHERGCYGINKDGFVRAGTAIEPTLDISPTREEGFDAYLRLGRDCSVIVCAYSAILSREAIRAEGHQVEGEGFYSRVQVISVAEDKADAEKQTRDISDKIGLIEANSAMGISTRATTVRQVREFIDLHLSQ